MKKFKLFVAVFIGVIVFVVIIQNMDLVVTRFLFWQTELPRALLLIICTLAGFVVGLLSALGVMSPKEKATKSQ